ncbi:hypothetical protein B0H19DRAFT_1271969 [Mycena capillaripes]|nr:hypothetical protein B0H19DRAFT_1271969 [Mycena capillaripes]
MTFNEVSRIAGHGYLGLMDKIPELLPQLGDHRLEARYISMMFSSTYKHPIVNPDRLVEQARVLFSNFKDTILEAIFYRVAGYHVLFHLSEHRRDAVKELLGGVFCMSKPPLRGPHPPRGLSSSISQLLLLETIAAAAVASRASDASAACVLDARLCVHLCRFLTLFWAAVYKSIWHN